MPKIIITLKKNWWIRDRILEVFCDGQRLGYLSKGESREFEVPVGQHKLKVKMGRFGSKDLSFNMYNKEARTFIFSRNKMMMAMTLIGLIIVFSIALITNRIFVHDYLLKFIFSTTPLFILVIYLQTLGRNKHLTITEGAGE